MNNSKDVSSVSTEDKLLQIHTLSSRIKSLKDQEMALRIEIVHELLTTKPAEGTHKFDYEGFAVKIKTSNSIIIDKSSFSHYEDKFTTEESNCIRWKAELNLTEYNQLPASKAKHLNKCLIVTPSAPTIDFTFIE